ncbi:MAG: hypothetical protein U1D55_02985 [Phycisphaerae bacterium]
MISRSSAIAAFASLTVPASAITIVAPPTQVESASISTVQQLQYSLDTGGMAVRGPGTTVYRAFPQAGGNVYWIVTPQLPRQVFDDGDLICGPGEPGPVRVTNVIFGGHVDTVPAPITVDALVTVFDSFNIFGAPGPAGVTPIVTFRVPIANVASQTQFTINVNVTALPGGGIVIPDRDFGVTVRYVNTGTTTTTAQPITPLLHADTIAQIGATSNGVGIDIDSDGTIESNEFGAFAPPLFTQLLLELIADQVPVPPPPPVAPAAACLGPVISDSARPTPGPLVVSSPIAANQVVWRRMSLSQDIVASVGGVPSSDTLDVHTDGSALSGAFPTDTVLSLYKADGTFVASNDDAPNAPANVNISALSFGDDLPRVTMPNAVPLGGEDGALAKGEYFVGISAFPAQVAPCGWRHLSTSPESGTVRLNISAALSSECAGDLNGDRVVNESDLGILLTAWNSSPCGDINGDGSTSEPDLGSLLAHWQAVCP